MIRRNPKIEKDHPGIGNQFCGFKDSGVIVGVVVGDDHEESTFLDDRPRLTPQGIEAILYDQEPNAVIFHDQVLLTTISV